MTGITYPPEMLPQQDDGDGEVWIVPADDSFGCWLLGVLIKREIGVRRGFYLPCSPKERRQAAEGMISIVEFDALWDGKCPGLT